MNTKTRYREAFPTVRTFKTFEHYLDHYYVICGDIVYSDDVRTPGASLLTAWHEKSITDTVLDLTGMTDVERKSYFASLEYVNWKCKTFKNVNNFEAHIELVEEPAAVNHHNHHPTRCSVDGRDEYATGTAVYNYGAKDLREPVSFLLASDSFQEKTGVQEVDFAQFIDYASQDAVLLGSKSFSIANFLAELTELKMLTKLFKFKTSDPLRTAAEGNLAWNFGISPFIGDIVKMYDIFLSLQGRIDAWNSMAEMGVLMNKHSRSRGNLAPFFHEENWEDPWSSFTRGTVKADVKSFSTYYHLYYRPIAIPDLGIQDIYFSVLGLRDPLNVVWEAIPFSFLVDWVYNVGDLIDHWSAADPIISMEIESFGYSRKLEMSVESTGESYRRDYNFSTDLNSLSLGKYMGTYVSYERQKLPVDSLPSLTAKDVGEWTLGDFGLKKASLIASLAIVLS